MTDEDRQTERSVTERIDGALHRVQEVRGHSGQVVKRIFTPLMVEVTWQDVGQLTVGACVLGIPMAYCEEVWTLGQELPAANALGLVAVSLSFLALFAYTIFYRSILRGHVFEYVERVMLGYVITFCVCALILALIQKWPLMTDAATALKRTVVVAFPACFSATVLDSLK